MMRGSRSSVERTEPRSRGVARAVATRARGAPFGEVAAPDPAGPQSDDARALRMFVVQLGAALNAAGHPAYAVQDQLLRVSQAYGAHDARISAFPSSLLIELA